MTVKCTIYQEVNIVSSVTIVLPEILIREPDKSPVNA